MSPAFQRLGRRLSRSPRSRWRRALAWVAAGALALAAGWLALPWVPLLPPDKSWSRTVVDCGGNLLTATLANDGRYRIWTPLDEFPPDLIAATLAHEDRRFRQHAGVDVRSVARAVWGLVSGRRSGGGSTISMQLARLRFGLETRRWSGKLVQMFRALQLERHYSKDQLLEAYLNLVPCGGNVEGSGTASRLWLNKSPADLTFRECVALSLVPQSPAKRNPARVRQLISRSESATAGGESQIIAPSTHSKAPVFFGERHRKDAGGKEAVRDAAIGPLQRDIIEALRGRSEPGDADFRLAAISRPPHAAPHFTRYVLKRESGPAIRSSLDPFCQETMERTLEDYLRQTRLLGVRNASALLVHAPTREVRAWVGSANFSDAAIQGKVDGVLARRSPGSVLKPFIYGLAIDQGIIHPQSLVSDAPAVFADYNPENYDRGFAGPIPAGEALRRSRNLPAIQLLKDLRPPGFYQFLKDGGVRLPYPAGHYGLALALGAEEVSVAEVAGLYALLADDGLPRPLRLTVAVADNEDRGGRHDGEGTSTSAPVSAPVLSHGGRPAAAGRNPLLSAGSRFLVRDMLRPTLPAPAEEGFTVGFPNVSWKTGTSHGWRDAWAAAISGEYVLVVWAGDFRGKPNPALTGRRTAAPLLFSILGALKLPCPEPVPQSEVKRVNFCAVSGDLPAPWCQQQKAGWYLPGVSPVRNCSLHQEIFVDAETGLRVAADDGRPGLRREVAEIWPPGLLDLFRRAGVPRRSPPPFENPEAPGGRVPRISSPRTGLTYTLRAGDPARRMLALQAEAAPGVTRLFWFAGREFLGSCPPAQPWFWTAVAGVSQIRVTDDLGRSASCQVSVNLIP